MKLILLTIGTFTCYAALMWLDFLLYCKSKPRTMAKKQDWDEWYYHKDISASGLYLWWKMRHARRRHRQQSTH